MNRQDWFKNIRKVGGVAQKDEWGQDLRTGWRATYIRKDILLHFLYSIAFCCFVFMLLVKCVRQFVFLFILKLVLHKLTFISKNILLLSYNGGSLY